MATAGRRVLCWPPWNRILATALDGFRVNASFQTARLSFFGALGGENVGLGARLS